MPTAVEHIRLAAHNVEFACHLNSHPKYHDWSATVAFYASVHIVDALLALENPPKHPTSHEARKRYLASSTIYQGIRSHLHILGEISLTARYMQDKARFAEYMSAHEVHDQLLKHRLHRVIGSALSLGKNKFKQPEVDALQTADEKLRSLPEPEDSGEPPCTK